MFLGRREPTSLRQRQNDQEHPKIWSKTPFLCRNVVRACLSADGRRRTVPALISGGLAFFSSFIGPPLFSSQEKSRVDANYSADAS